MEKGRKTRVDYKAKGRVERRGGRRGGERYGDVTEVERAREKEGKKRGKWKLFILSSDGKLKAT